MTALDLEGALPLLCSFTLPVHAHKLFTYRVPGAMAGRARPGVRAILPVGRGTKVGVLVERDVPPFPGDGVLRDVERILDREPVIGAHLLGVLLDAAVYYHHPAGLAVESALPPGKTSSHAVRYGITDAGHDLLASGSARDLDRRLLELVSGGAKTLVQLARHAPLAGQAQIDDMIKRGLVNTAQTGRGARVEKILRLLRMPGAGERTPGEVGKKVLEALGRTDGVTLSALRRSLPVPDSTIRSLVARGLVEVRTDSAWMSVELTSDAFSSAYQDPPGQLTSHQKQAVATINNAIARGGFSPFLLHGITGSGKTEVYIHAIRSVLRAGRSAVVLVPEIALTPQLVAMFRSRVGEEIAILHSALPLARRRAQWDSIRSGQRRVVIGARSAVFAPVRDPGIFVVDEEHDTSFKQGEMFRYHARDLSLLRAQREGAAVILGSATPAMESFHNALGGKYGLLTLPERATTQPLPEVEVVDLRIHRSGPAGQPFVSGVLYRAIEETLAHGGQIILFLNRRGFAPAATCTSCGEPVRCPECSVALVHHRFTDRLSCHYCGHSRDVPATCPGCGAGGDAMELVGPGTERIEQIVSDLFPRARVLRMDSDVASGTAAEPILRAMREKRADILVGTQMVTKGHDLPGVALVGVVRADMGMSMPDFRAAERTFQMLTQVAGRAGRGDVPGRVILQTYNPEHPCIDAARSQDYQTFYTWELAHRRATGYPPYTHLALVKLSGPDEQAAARGAAELGIILGPGPSRVLGPVSSPLARLRGRFRHQIMLKADSRRDVRRSLELLPDPTWALSQGLRSSVDVDPLDFL